jgi:hypothetical protein
MVDLLARGVDLLARGAGTGLRGTFGLLARLRPAAKPLHPRGIVRTATVHRYGLDEPCGVPWLDGPGTDQVLVRTSRAVGLPGPLPDVHGLAMRVPVDGERVADLLFATTGSGLPGRFLLRPHRSAAHATYSTLLPYRTPTGPVLLAVRPVDGGLQLAAARPTGPWRRYGALELDPADLDAAQPDEGAATDNGALISFDPVLNTLPGLQPYQWVRDLREGAYAAARGSRRGRERGGTARAAGARSSSPPDASAAR